MTTRGVSMSVLCHNRPRYLASMMEMFAAEARLMEDPLEVILVDDASTDPALHFFYATLANYEHVRVLKKDHDLQMPESWARNVTRGFQASKYDILWHWDDDTLIEGEPGWVQKTADLLRKHPQIGSLAPYRTGIMEPFAPSGDREFELSFGLTEPCFALRRDTFDRLGGVDDTLRWFYGPDYSLRMMVDLGLECCFFKTARQIDLFPRGGVPQDTFPRADGAPYYKKWTDRFGVGEHAWPPYVRHRERVANALPAENIAATPPKKRRR
jgi:hypothetical protein